MARAHQRLGQRHGERLAQLSNRGSGRQLRSSWNLLQEGCGGYHVERDAPTRLVRGWIEVSIQLQGIPRLVGLVKEREELHSPSDQSLHLLGEKKVPLERSP